MVCASALSFRFAKRFRLCDSKVSYCLLLSSFAFCRFVLSLGNRMFCCCFCLDKQDELKQERNLSSQYGSISLKVCLHNVNVECSHKLAQSLSPQCGMFPQIHTMFVSTIWNAPTNSHKVYLHNTACSHKVCFHNNDCSHNSWSEQYGVFL